MPVAARRTGRADQQADIGRTSVVGEPARGQTARIVLVEVEITPRHVSSVPPRSGSRHAFSGSSSIGTNTSTLGLGQPPSHVLASA
jgi:hypothetical protein